MAIPIQEIATGTRALILERAIPIFAKSGFAGASMRELANTVGITPAALYYHFPDKETLYFQAMRYAYADQSEAFLAALQLKGPPQKRLEAFITKLVEHMYGHPDFRRLLQRERMEGDEHRLKLLAEYLFQDQFKEMTALTREFAPQFDPHMLAISISGLVSFHIETAQLRRFLPGNKKAHDDPAVVAKHVIQLVARIAEQPQE